jgi:hypothetical protein
MCIISFVIRLYLLLLTSVQTFDVTEVGMVMNPYLNVFS